MLQKISTWIRRGIIVLWILALVGIFGYSLYNPSFFTANSLKIFLEQFGKYLLIVYFILSALRGFTLIPSTPFVIVGLLLFPDNLYFVYFISMSGILLSATMMYFFSREMGFEEMLRKNHEKYIQQCENWIQRYGFFAVTIWSFLIIVPTDIICYIAGILQMRFWKFILAVGFGEGIICIILIFWGDTFIELTKTVL